MKDVIVTIHPCGWITIAVVLVVIFLCGYVAGIYHTLQCEAEDILFDFEKQK